MVRCYAGKPGSFRRKPLSDRFGHYVSRAPFWFIEATGQHPTWTSFQPDKSTPVAVDPHEEDLS